MNPYLEIVNYFIVVVFFIGSMIQTLLVFHSIFQGGIHLLTVTGGVFSMASFLFFSVQYGRFSIEGFPGGSVGVTQIIVPILLLALSTMLQPVWSLIAVERTRELMYQREVALEKDIKLIEAEAERKERQVLISAMEVRYKTQQSIIEELRRKIINNVGHELRTPLTIVLGYSSMIIEGSFGDLPKKMIGPIEIIDMQSRRMQIIVDRMIVMLRQPHPEVFDLREIIFKIIKSDDIYLTTRKTRKDVVVSISQTSKDVRLNADMLMIKTAIFELINNAVKFQDNSSNVMVEWVEVEDSIKITVTDNGIGIEKTNFRKIFQPMIQLDMSSKRRFEGAGMGLAVVQQVAEQHNGYVEVESQIGEGSKFHLIIPVDFRRE